MARLDVENEKRKIEIEKRYNKNEDILTMRTEKYISALRYAFCAGVLALAACTDDDAPTSGTLPQPPASTDPEGIYSDVPIVIGAGMAGASAIPTPWGAPAKSLSTRAGEEKVFDGKGPLESGMTFNALIVAWEEADFALSPEYNNTFGVFSQPKYDRTIVGSWAPYKTYTWAEVVTLTASATPQTVTFSKPRYYRADGTKTHLRMIGPISDKLARYWREYPDRVNDTSGSVDVTLSDGSVVKAGSLLRPGYGWEGMPDKLSSYDEYEYTCFDIVYSNLVTSSKDDAGGKQFTLSHLQPRLDLYFTMTPDTDLEYITLNNLQSYIESGDPSGRQILFPHTTFCLYFIPTAWGDWQTHTDLSTATYNIFVSYLDGVKSPEVLANYPWNITPQYVGYNLLSRLRDYLGVQSPSIRVDRGKTTFLGSLYLWEEGAYNKYTTFAPPYGEKSMHVTGYLPDGQTYFRHPFTLTIDNSRTPWPDHVGFKAGVAYRVELVAKPKQIEAQVSVTDWDMGGSGSVTVN